MFHILFALGFSLALGSFANVCIYRIPLKLSVLFPRRSYCPWCQNEIAWHQNIPLASFVLQRARCQSCVSSISPRYFFVELLNPLLCMPFFFLFYEFTLPQYLLVALIVFFSVVVSVIDFDWRIIPDEISFVWLLIIFLCAPFNPVLTNFSLGLKYLHSLLGIFSSALIVWIVLALGKIIKDRDVMGWGDVKLIACWGALLGWPFGVFVFFTAALFATFMVVIGKIFRTVRSSDFIPFGPFLNLAGLVIFWLKLANLLSLN